MASTQSIEGKVSRYSFTVTWSEEDDAYVALCPAFPGLSSFGETRGNAIEEAAVALELFIEEYEEHGWELPEPDSLEEYSGQTVIRMPRSLHKNLAEQAENDEVSLNMLMVSRLSHAAGAADEREVYMTEMLNAARQLTRAVQGVHDAANHISEQVAGSNDQYANGPYQDNFLNQLAAQRSFE